MKRMASALLAAIAVVVIVGVGFFVYAPGLGTRTVGCTITRYAVWSLLEINGTSTTDTTSTFSSVSSYTTTTWIARNAGQVVSTSTTQATLTGAMAAGNETTCTYLTK